MNFDEIMKTISQPAEVQTKNRGPIECYAIIHPDFKGAIAFGASVLAAWNAAEACLGDSAGYLRRCGCTLQTGSWSDNTDRYRAFLERFLNPEDLGYAVNAALRDEVREVLGMEKVEGK